MENPADIIYIGFQLALGEDGGRNAMTRIWTVYGKGIYYYISRSFPGDRYLCDDCFQETMLKAYHGLNSYRIGLPLKPWLYRIAHNCCLDQLRRRNEESIDDTAELAAPERGGLEENFMRSELVIAIDNGISGLGAGNAQIAYLRFFEGMKFKDIAKIMGMNEKTVKTRMDAIKRKLRTELKEWL